MNTSKHIINILLFVFVLISNPLIAQLQIEWQQCYCSTDADIARDISPTSGGYLVIGYQSGGDGQVNCSEEPSIWLLKIGYDGHLIWQKCLTGAGAYKLQKSMLKESEYYYIGGAYSEPYPDAYNLRIGKIDSTGDYFWKNTFGCELGVSQYGFNGISTTDGGFIACCHIMSQGGDITNYYGSYDGWLIKVDSLGNKEWDFTMGTENHAEYLDGVIQCNDNGYLALLSGAPDGTTGNINCSTNDPQDFNAIIYKIDSTGNPEWHKCYGGSEGEGVIVASCLLDGYLILGYTKSNDGDLTGAGWHGHYDIWLMRTNLYGDVVWQKCYGGTNHDFPKEIFQTSDGGFFIIGETKSNNGDVAGNPSYTDRYSVWILK